MSLFEPWSNNPNAPNISHKVYQVTKTTFVGDFLTAMLYGVVTVVFYQCMSALLNPVNHARGGIKWGLMSYTVAMFSCVTIFTTTNLYLSFNAWIDDQQFPGPPKAPPGTLGYKFLVYTSTLEGVPDFMLILNSWLADGLLLYRCYVFFAMDYRVIAVPCLMYLASLITGILYVYQSLHPAMQVLRRDSRISFNINFYLPYFPIALSLNVLLTLMIIIRLIRHSRAMRDAIGPPASHDRLYKDIITMLVESCAIYAVSFLLFVIPWGNGSSLVYVFWPILNETQAIAPLLIIRRVGNLRASASESIGFGSIDSIRFRNEGSSMSDETPPGGDRASLIDTDGVAGGECGVGAGADIDEVPR